MTLSAIATLFAASVTQTMPPPLPLPVVLWVKPDGSREVARIVFVGFDVDRAPRAPLRSASRRIFTGVRSR